MAGYPDSENHRRGAFLTAMAALLALAAVSDITKPLQHLRAAHLGIVVLGVRMESFFSNLVVGGAVGIFLAAYAYGVWTMQRWVMPLAVIYAFWVPVNLVLFWFMFVGDHPPVRFIVIYMAVALTSSIGTALYLALHRDRLR